MGLTLTLLLATSSMFLHAKNGETGVLIGVQSYHVDMEQQEEENLYLCHSMLKSADQLQSLGLVTYMRLGNLGKFRLIKDQSGTFQLQGYKTRVLAMECASSGIDAIEIAYPDQN